MAVCPLWHQLISWYGNNPQQSCPCDYMHSCHNHLSVWWCTAWQNNRTVLLSSLVYNPHLSHSVSPEPRTLTEPDYFLTDKTLAIALHINPHTHHQDGWNPLRMGRNISGRVKNREHFPAGVMTVSVFSDANQRVCVIVHETKVSHS